MKKYLVVALLLAGVCLAPNKSHAAAPIVDTLYSSGTASKLIVGGAGSLFAIHITSGAAGDYAVCYDTGSASGITTTLGGSTAVPELLRVFVSTGGALSPGIPGQGVNPPGVPIVSFTNGLGCIQSAPNRTNIYFRQPS